MIAEEVSAQKKKKTIRVIILTIAILATAVWLLHASFKSAINRSAITTAVVEKGDIENTISATGEILPEFEEIITSPINDLLKMW